MWYKLENEIKTVKIGSVEMLERCSEVLMEAYNRPPWNDSWTRETAAALLTCYYHTPRFRGWAVTSGNRIIGCCAGNIEPHYGGDIFVLRELFIAVRFQKFGVGRRLIAAMKNDLQLTGVKTIILFTNKAVVDFYIKCGFKEREGIMMVYTDKDN